MGWGGEGWGLVGERHGRRLARFDHCVGPVHDDGGLLRGHDGGGVGGVVRRRWGWVWGLASTAAVAFMAAVLCRLRDVGSAHKQ